MHCPACQADVLDDAKFCPQCGERLDPDGVEHPAAPVPTPLQRMRPAGSSGDEPAEELLWTGGYSGKAMVGTWIGAGFLSVFLLIVGAFFPVVLLGMAALLLLAWCGIGLLLAYRKLNVNYELTTQRFVHRSGILRRVTDRIEAIDMDDVAFEQGIIERLLNVGTIRVSSSDRSHPELLLRGISDVERVAKLIDDTRHKERLRRGLHIEAI